MTSSPAPLLPASIKIFSFLDCIKIESPWPMSIICTNTSDALPVKVWSVDLFESFESVSSKINPIAINKTINILVFSYKNLHLPL